MNKFIQQTHCTVLKKYKTLSIFVVFCSIFLLIPFTSLALNKNTTSDDVIAPNILSLINTERLRHNLPILRTNPILQQSAEDKAHDMVLHKYFSHKDPNGHLPWMWLEKNSYNYAYAGENLSIGFISATAQHNAWMKSPFHKRNILNRNYNETGIAVVHGTIRNNEELIVVQFFGKLPPIVANNPQKNTQQSQMSYSNTRPPDYLLSKIAKNKHPYLNIHLTIPSFTKILPNKTSQILLVIIFLCIETAVSISVVWQLLHSQHHKFCLDETTAVM